MLPTDHAELLERGIYPIINSTNKFDIAFELDSAIIKSCTDGLGTFCSIQIFYIEIIKEDAATSPILLDRVNLPKLLLNAVIKYSTDLQALILTPNGLHSQIPYRKTLMRMRILSRDHNIDWGTPLPM